MNGCWGVGGVKTLPGNSQGFFPGDWLCSVKSPLAALEIVSLLGAGLEQSLFGIFISLIGCCNNICSRSGFPVISNGFGKFWQ